MRVPNTRKAVSAADQLRDLLQSLTDKGPQPRMRVSDRLRKAALAGGYVEVTDGPALMPHALDSTTRKRPLTIKYLQVTDAGKAMLDTPR